MIRILGGFETTKGQYLGASKSAFTCPPQGWGHQVTQRKTAPGKDTAKLRPPKDASSFGEIK